MVCFSRYQLLLANKLFSRGFKQTRDVTCTEKAEASLNSDYNLVNRDLVCIRNLTTCEIKEVLWTAMDLKALMQQRKSLVRNYVAILIL